MISGRRLRGKKKDDMPRPPEDLDIWAAIQYLLQRVEQIGSGSDASFRATATTTAPTVSTATGVDADTPASENPTSSVVLPAVATSTAVDTDTPASENPTSSVPIPSVTTSAAVI